MNKNHILFWFAFIVAACLALFAYWRNRKNSPAIGTCSLKHIGIIMDGNRRWAKKQGFKPWIGHKQGVEPIKETIAFCLENNIPYLTLYAFSLENFNRPPEELHYLFDVLAKELAGETFKQLADKEVHVSFMGDRALFPAHLVTLIEDIEAKTRTHTKLHLSILFCYGGQQEIVSATKKICSALNEGTLTLADVNEKTFSSFLWTGDTPAPDLIIRTGGMKRLSNFLTYQSAYSEFIFLDCYWPELTRKELEVALKEFTHRQRNFGA